MENIMKSFKEIRENQYPEVRKYLKKMKGKQVSFTDNDGKTKKTGEFGGLMNRGGRPYAKVHHKGGMALVPLPQINMK